MKPFTLKSGDSVNRQTKKMPNEKLKTFYNDTKEFWILKHGITKCTPHQINVILLESWDTFKLSYKKSSRTALKILTLIPSDFSTNT